MPEPPPVMKMVFPLRFIEAPGFEVQKKDG
jgi:hypothetical protein